MDNIIGWVIMHNDVSVCFDNMHSEKMDGYLGVRMYYKQKYVSRKILSSCWYTEKGLWSIHTLLNDMYADIKALEESEDNKND